jgi:hypothetical protein
VYAQATKLKKSVKEGSNAKSAAAATTTAAAASPGCGKYCVPRVCTSETAGADKFDDEQMQQCANLLLAAFTNNLCNHCWLTR